MGKAAKWFRGLLSFKKPDSAPPQQPPSSKQQKENRRWSFVRSYREKGDLCQNAAKLGGYESRAASGGTDPKKRAIAAAAETAVEAAVAAAQAAVAVVRLTSSRRPGNVTSKAYGGGSCGFREEWIAAVKIQSAFRGYLARKALRALRGLVRLQAMVRGHIERKRTTEWLQRMQALLRAQARARAGRSQISDSSRSSTMSSQAHYLGPATPEKSEELIRAKSRKHDQLLILKKNGSNLRDRTLLERNRSDRYANQQSLDLQGSYTTAGTADDQRSDKILEIDTGKQHLTTKSRNHFHPSLHVDQDSHSYTASKDSTAQFPSLSCGEVQSLCTLKLSQEVEDGLFCTADNSPQFFSASSRGGSSRRSPLTPSKSDGSRSYLNGYSDHPNYMSYTESSKAKARSLSAPKQRPHFDRSGSSKRNSIHGYGESRPGSQKVSGLHANFRNKAYPGSGRLDQLGMPVGFRS